MDISIVIPLFNEEESLPELHEWITRVMQEHGYSYEVIYIDDGSKDDSWKVVMDICKQDEHTRAIKFRRNYGKSAGLNEGFKAAEGNVVITMDADLQDSPDEIPELYRMITEDKFDLVSGWKQKRHDPLEKTLPSKLYNGTLRAATGIKLHDFNCGLKAYRSEVVKSVEVYGEMHRYIPVMSKKAGFGKITEKVVQHQERKYGYSKFGYERYITGLLDFLSILFITRFGKKPMHLFGGLGVLSFLLGFLILLYLTITKFAFQAYGMTQRPLFYLGLVVLVIGVQLFLTGFMAELISRSSADRNHYLIAKKVGFDD